jgi:hypothetical protein
MMKRKRVPGLLICGLGCLGPIGCSSSQPRALDASLFIPPSLAASTIVSAPAASVASVIHLDAPHDEVPKNASVLPSNPAKPFDTLQPLDPLQPTPSQTVSPSAGPVALAPTTAPSSDTTPTDAATLAMAPVSPTALTGDSSPTTAPSAVAGSLPAAGQGVYMTLGGVLAQVNNTAVYANQVLSPLKKEFAAKAREMDADAFRRMAEEEIDKQLQEVIDDELYFATSYRELSDDDKKLAEAIAMQFRQQRVTAAGGSVERAKRLAAEDGEDFDASIKQEYRRIVHDLYVRRKIEPLIKVTADSMRDFYQTNLTKLYSEKDRVQFRVIEIDPANAANPQAALDKITGIRTRVLNGEDFGKLASTVNEDAFLKGRAGNPCDDGAWMDRDTYRIDAVEAALWSLQPGQVTPVIQSDGLLYIACLDAKKLGKVRQFDDPVVQQDIHDRIYQQQMADLWQKSRNESVDEKIVNTDDSRIQIAVDMAMQTYAMAH